MANAIVKEAFIIGDKIAKEQGMYLVDASFDHEKDGDFLRLYIDKEGGVGIDDCEVFSKAFDEKFDENLIKTKYCLEVSSPGVDRTLKTEREFVYYTGRDVDVKLYSGIDGLKEFTAKLSGYDNGKIMLLIGEKEIEVSKSNAVYIKLSFKM